MAPRPEGSESRGIVELVGCGWWEEVGMRMSPFGLEEASLVATIWVGDACGRTGFRVKKGGFFTGVGCKCLWDYPQRCVGVSLGGGLARNTVFGATGREGVFRPEKHEDVR